MSKKKVRGLPAPVVTEPTPVVEKRKRRRRRRRSSAQVLAARTITDIKQKERQFLREVSAILTEALGFPVKVSHVKVPVAPLTPTMRHFARMPKAKARRQIAESFHAPLNDKLPI